MMGFDELETIDCPLNEMEKNGDQQWKSYRSNSYSSRGSCQNFPFAF
jgi:hypothetical protein